MIWVCGLGRFYCYRCLSVFSVLVVWVGFGCFCTLLNFGLELFNGDCGCVLVWICVF